MDKLIQALDEFRLEKRITQMGLASLLGVSFVTVNRWFNGRQSPNKIQTHQIKKLLASKGKKK